MIDGIRIVTSLLMDEDAASRVELPLRPALEAALAHFKGRPVGAKQLDEIQVIVSELMRERCLQRWHYSLRGWRCMVWMMPLRPPPVYEIAVRDWVIPQELWTGVIRPSEHGRVQVVFVDPHGIFCELETVETMAQARWNSGLGWGKR